MSNSVFEYELTPAREVLGFLGNAEAGESFVYAVARTLPASGSRGIDAVRGAYNDGLVDLCQRRERDGRFSYIVQMRAKPARIAPEFRFTN